MQWTFYLAILYFLYVWCPLALAGVTLTVDPGPSSQFVTIWGIPNTDWTWNVIATLISLELDHHLDLFSVISNQWKKVYI